VVSETWGVNMNEQNGTNGAQVGVWYSLESAKNGK